MKIGSRFPCQLREIPYNRDMIASTPPTSNFTFRNPADIPNTGEIVRVFRRNLVRLRKAHGFSQGDLFRRTGMGQTRISDIERGRTRPTLDTICRLAKALGVMPTDLLR